MFLTKTPVEDVVALQKVLDGLLDVPSNYKIAVEALIFSEDGKLLLHKRGKGCRDEIGKLEGIGGRFEEADGNFLDAIKREIREEMGEEAQIEVGSFFEIRKDAVRDVKNDHEQHWIIVSYLCKYIGGALKIMEPHKNEGFFFVDIHAVDETTLSSSALSALQSLRD